MYSGWQALTRCAQQTIITRIEELYEAEKEAKMKLLQNANSVVIPGITGRQ